MRILFTTMPATGHFRPLMPIAQAARRRAHRVAVCTAATAGERIRAYGLDHLVAGTDWVREGISEIAELAELPSDHMDRVRAHLTTQGYAGEAALRMARDILAHSATWRPDLIVRENAEFGGYLAAEALGVPHVSVGVGGAGSEYLDVAALAPALDAGRRSLGLPADLAGERVHAYLHVNLTPESYDPKELSVPNVRCYRQANPEVPGERLPSWVAELPPSLPIVFACFGTMYPLMAAWDATVRSVVAGLAEVPCTAIVAAGPREHTGGLHVSHVRMVGHIAQPLMLEASDLLITHGGFNSVREALRLAVPMIIIPWGNDTPITADRCRDAGVARVIDFHELTPERLRDACLEVLGDDRYRRNAARIQREYLTMATVDDLVTDLEEIAARPDRIGKSRSVSFGATSPFC
jgi:N-glycosyltransferase